MEVDERLETLCEEFTDLEEPEKDYILGISQSLAHSIGTMPPPSVAGVERAMSEYRGLIKENLA